jgi:two-component system chemotaxis response regulator CheB
MREPRTAIVVVGASAGGVEALQRLVSLLPRDLRAPVLVVLHLPPTAVSVLPAILGRAHAGVVERVVDGMALEPGGIYVAPPDRHLIVEGAHLKLGTGAQENGHRPAIDTTIRTAVTAFGDRVLGMLLSGLLDDGVNGLARIRAAGGLTAVQDPGEAAYPGMSEAAIESGVADHVMRLDDLANLICDEIPDMLPPLEELVLDTDPDPHDPNSTVPSQPGGDVSALTCPACGGALWEDAERHMAVYKCRTGHAYGPESLLDAQSETIETALWSAYRALLERADLSRRMARRLHRSGVERSADRYERMAALAQDQAMVLHDALVADTPILAANRDADHG